MKLFGYEIMSKGQKDKLMAKAASRRGIGGGSRFLQLVIGRGGSVSSTDVDVKFFVQEGYQQCPPVFSIVNSIADGVGKAVWCIKDANGNEIDVPLLTTSIDGVPPIMKQANDIQSWTDMNIEATVHELTEGNLFMSGDLGTSGLLNTLYILPTDGMHIFGDAKKRRITRYRQQYSWTEGDEWKASEMLHVKYPNPDWTDGNAILFGQSPLEPVRASIVAYNRSLDAGVFFLENKGAQKLVYNEMEDMDLDMGIEGEETFKQSIIDRGQGVDNNGNLLVIDGAKLGAIDISSDPKKALVLEQRAQAALEICNVYGFPPEKLGLKDATYQNGKEASKAYWEHCVVPILERRKAAFQKFLMPGFSKKMGQEIYIDYSLDHIDALQEDKLLRGKAIKEFAGMITINEARMKAGMAPIDSIGETSGEDMYVGFTQAVVSDQAEISDQNGTNESQKE